MIALFIASIFILLIILLLFARVRVIAEYGVEGALVVVRTGPIRIMLYPREKVREKKPKEKREQEKDMEQGGSVEVLRDLLEHVLKAAARIHKELVIEYLQMDYLSAAESPAWAALGFGLASAGIGVLVPMLERRFIIKERKLRTGVSYTLKKPEVYGKAILSLRVGQILSISGEFLIGYLKEHTKKKKQRRKA